MKLSKCWTRCLISGLLFPVKMVITPWYKDWKPWNIVQLTAEFNNISEGWVVFYINAWLNLSSVKRNISWQPASQLAKNTFTKLPVWALSPCIRLLLLYYHYHNNIILQSSGYDSETNPPVQANMCISICFSAAMSVCIVLITQSSSETEWNFCSWKC